MGSVDVSDFPLLRIFIHIFANVQLFSLSTHGLKTWNVRHCQEFQILKGGDDLRCFLLCSLEMDVENFEPVRVVFCDAVGLLILKYYVVMSSQNSAVYSFTLHDLVNVYNAISDQCQWQQIFDILHILIAVELDLKRELISCILKKISRSICVAWKPQMVKKSFENKVYWKKYFLK